MNSTPQIAIIVAMDQEQGIGLRGDMPWRLSADLKRFKQITMGYPLIMGRRTFESLPGGALPGRMNVVISGNEAFRPEGVHVVGSPEEALALCRDFNQVFIIGGGQLYQYFLETADLLHITMIEHTYDADTWFPPFDAGKYTVMAEERVENDGKFPYPYTFITLEKK
jgi:dihydrofolate reductase